MLAAQSSLDGHAVSLGELRKVLRVLAQEEDLVSARAVEAAVLSTLMQRRPVYAYGEVRGEPSIHKIHLRSTDHHHAIQRAREAASSSIHASQTTRRAEGVM